MMRAGEDATADVIPMMTSSVSVAPTAHSRVSTARAITLATMATLPSVTSLCLLFGFRGGANTSGAAGILVARHAYGPFLAGAGSL